MAVAEAGGCEPFYDDAQLSMLVVAARAAACNDEAAHLTNATHISEAAKLDALLIGPTKSGKSTTLNALVGQLVCPPSGVLNSLFLVAYSVQACLPKSTERVELCVPATLRERLSALVGDDKLPADGPVRDSADLKLRLETLHAAGRGVAQELLDYLDVVAQPIEVVRYAADSEHLSRQWRLVDFPGTSERIGLASGKLIEQLIDHWLNAMSTALIICVVALDQLGTENTSLSFATLLHYQKPIVWFINKVDSNADFGSVEQMQPEMHRLTQGHPVLYGSAQQIVAYQCAELLRKKSDDCSFLPPLTSSLHDSHLLEVDAVIRVLAPSFSRVSRQWKRQYQDVASCSFSQLCRATQFPDPEVESSDEGEQEQEGNWLVRSALWAHLAKSRARLVLNHLRPSVLAAMNDAKKKLKAAVEVAGEVQEALQTRMTQSIKRRHVLQACMASVAIHDEKSLAALMVNVAEQHLQPMLSADSAASDPSSQEPSDVDQMTIFHTALERAENALTQLQRDYLAQENPAWSETHEALGLVETIPLLAEVENKTGTVRVFESALFMLFTKFSGEAKNENNWFANSARFYLDGARSMASSVAKRVLDSFKSRMASALKHVKEELLQCQWHLAHVEKCEVNIWRLQCLYVSLIWMNKSVGVDPTDEDLEQLGCQHREAVQNLAGTKACTVEDLVTKHSEWAAWAIQASFETSQYKRVYTHENAPKSIEELFDIVGQLVFANAAVQGLPRPATVDFLKRLLASTSHHDTLASAAAKLWTSMHQLRGKEFCGFVNAAIRADADPVLIPAVQFILALHPLSFSLRAQASDLEWLSTDGHVFRGGGLPKCYRAFFGEGQRYCLPMPLSLYFSSNAALTFLAQRRIFDDDRQPVLWKVKLNSAATPPNAFILEPEMTESSERELLFKPHTCFHVVHVEWRDQATVKAPHSIEVFACPDGAAHWNADEWVFAPWG